jgi:hypothetical protein
VTSPNSFIPLEDAHGYKTFHHLAAVKVGFYRSILRVFGQAKEHFEISLRPGEVAERLASKVTPSDLEEVAQALEQLHK